MGSKFDWLDSYTERDFRELLGDIQWAAFEDGYANDSHRVNTIRGLLQNFMENASERRIRA